MSGNDNPSPCYGVENSCCPDRQFPDVVHAALSSAQFKCNCNETIELVYDAVNDWWHEDGVPNCTNSEYLRFSGCGLHYNCTGTDKGANRISTVCDPLSITFEMVDSTNACCGHPDVITVVITE